MTHARQQIRERIASNVGALTTTGSRVFQSRVYNLEQSSLPALLIYSKSETDERDTFQTMDGLTRNLAVVIEGYANGASNLDDTLDTISEEVEIAVAADPTCNGLAKDCSLEATDIDFDGEGDSPVGVVRMTWAVLYRTTTTAPGTAI